VTEARISVFYEDT